jgi:hypothetical protein
MSSGAGRSKRRPVSRIRVLARTRRCDIVAGATRNARPICSADRPSTVCSINGARAAGSIAGWAQMNKSRSRSSRKAPTCGASSCEPASERRISSGAARSRTSRARSTLRSRFRAAVTSQASGFSGTPRSGQVASAAISASDSASSAAAMSRLCTARIAIKLAITGAGRLFGSPARVGSAARSRGQSVQAGSGTTGRISTEPVGADGDCAAHSSAASRSGTSITK